MLRAKFRSMAATSPKLPAPKPPAQLPAKPPPALRFPRSGAACSGQRSSPPPGRSALSPATVGASRYSTRPNGPRPFRRWPCAAAPAASSQAGDRSQSGLLAQSVLRLASAEPEADVSAAAQSSNLKRCSCVNAVTQASDGSRLRSAVNSDGAVKATAQVHQGSCNACEAVPIV